MATIEDLEEIISAEQERQAGFRHRVLVCTASGCPNGQRVAQALSAAVESAGLQDRAEVVGVGCMGLCARGTLVAALPQERLYGPVEVEDAPAIIDSLDGDPLERLLIDTTVPFFAKQRQIVLESSGRVDPDSIESSLAAGGYASLVRAITEMTPFEVLDEINRSGLRGRGGGGYPTGLKLATVAKAEGELKYVICNADEGDPGAFMDRSVLESDPHRVLEGMAIAAYAVGARRGFIYVRAEYPLAIERLQTAIKRARRVGLLRRDILGTTFSFEVEVRLGAGAFVCGEETALMTSIEGRQGNPRPRPPYPAESGLWGHPTLINNVETLANIPAIIRDGAGAFASVGTEGSKGTKVFALAGKVQNTGLIEVPMGTTLTEIIHEIGGGVPDGHTCKAAQTGGPSGGCIPVSLFGTPVDYESLKELGSMMGSGGMIVMDETSDMVDVARFFMEFCMTESCGKCVPCRVGTAQLYDLLQRITDRTASPDELETLKDLCHMVRDTSLCGLGQSAPNPVLSTLRHFHEEYVEHVASDPGREA